MPLCVLLLQNDGSSSMSVDLGSPCTWVETFPSFILESPSKPVNGRKLYPDVQQYHYGREDFIVQTYIMQETLGNLIYSNLF